MPRGVPMKRPAASTAEGVAKKPATSAKSATRMQCNVVCAAVEGAVGFPKQVRDMLTSTLPESLGVPKEERHPFQEQVIEMVSKVMQSLEAGIQGEIDAAEKTLGDAETEKGSRKAAEEASAATAASKAEATQAAKAAVAEGISAHQAARTTLNEAEVEQATGNENLEKAAEKKAMLESAVADLFTPLKEGTAEAAEAGKKASEFTSLVTGFGFDASLVTSLPNVLTKSPADRGTFDSVVLDQTEAELGKCRDALVSTIENAEPARKERDDKVEALRAKLTEAVDAEKACKAALAAAKAEQKEAEAAHKAAAKAVQQFGPEMKKVAAGFEAAKARLETLKAGPLKTFQDLLVYTAIPPPVEEKAEGESAPAEDTAPAEGTAAEAEAAQE